MFGKNKKGRVPSAKKDFTKLKTPHTYAIIFFVVVACWLLTFLIPAGKFSTHEIEYQDANGETATRTVLMADTFRYSYNLDTDFVADALADISKDQELMDEMEVDPEALSALLETDSSAWTQADLDAVGISDDEMYSLYGEDFYDTSEKLHKTAGIWGTQDFGGFGFMNYVFEGLVTGDRSGSAVGLCALILVSHRRGDLCVHQKDKGTGASGSAAALYPVLTGRGDLRHGGRVYPLCHDHGALCDRTGV